MRALARRPGRAAVALLLVAGIGFGLFFAGTHLWALYHFRSAEAALERYHSEEAREHLEACMEVWPRDPAALLLAARAARRLRDYDRAAAFLDGYHKERGQDDELILERALLRAERGEFDEVRPFLHALLLQGHPSTSLILEAVVSSLAQNYRLVEAEEFLDQWLRREPENAQAHLFKGHIHQLKVQEPDAVVAYRRVLEIDPEFDEARVRLAGLLVDMAQPREALTHLEYLRPRRPWRPGVLVDVARCLDQLDRPDEAEAALEEVLDRRPDHAQALGVRGGLAARAGRLAEAEGLLRKACALEPRNYELHYQLSQCLMRRGRMAEVRELQPLLKSIEADNKRLPQIVREDLQHRPHDPALHHELGMIAMRAGAVPQGLRWLESALKLDPGHVPTHRALAAYYDSTGERIRAGRHRAIAQAASPPETPPPAAKRP